MRTIEVFRLLHKGLGCPTRNTRIKCAKEDVAKQLGCTARNATLVLKRLEQYGWIKWEPGRGRGNKSALTFLRDENDVTVEAAKQKIMEGALWDGFRLLERASLDSESKRVFMQWVFSRLGYFEENATESVRHEILRIPFYRPLAAMDPVFVSRRTEAHIVRQICDTLVQVNAASQEVQPHLAHHIEPDETLTRWKVFLRKGVLFHSGSEMTSYDVAYTLNRLTSPDCPYRSLFTDIQSTEVVSRYELEVRLQCPNILFPHLLAMTPASIVPRPTYNERKLDPRIPIGTGPFRIVQNDENMVVLEAFDRHFFGRPLLDRIEMWVVPEHMRASESVYYEQGMHYASRLLDSADEYWMQKGNLELGCKYITFNMVKPGPQQSFQFRKLLGKLLAPANIIRIHDDSRLHPATSFLPAVSQRNERWVIEPRLPSRALRHELVKAGYDGSALILLTYEMPTNVEEARWIQQALCEMGVDVKLNVVPATQMSEAAFKEADMVLSGEVFDRDIILSYLGLFCADYSPIRHLMDRGLRAKTDALFKKLKRERLDYPSRLSLLLTLEQLMRDNHFVLFLYHEQQHAAVAPNVRGIVMDSLGWLDYRKLWFQLVR